GARDVRSDIGLVLVIGADDFDLHALGGGAEIVNRHLCRHNGAGAPEVGINSRHVIQHADLDRAVGKLRLRGAAAEYERERGETDLSFHWHPSHCASDSNAKVLVEFSDIGVEIGIGKMIDDTPIFHHVVAIRNRCGEAKVLLDQEYREALLLEHSN